MSVNNRPVVNALRWAIPVTVVGSVLLAACTGPTAQVGETSASPSNRGTTSTPEPDPTPENPEAGFLALPVDLQPRRAPTTGASPIFYRGPKRIGTAKALYLTYDDGPDDASTIAVAKALKDNNATATFFALGNLAATTSGRATLKHLTREGFPVGMHSWSHPVMGGWSASAVSSDFSRTSGAIKRATGLTPTCFRPPYGSFGKGITDAAKTGAIQVAMWDIDPEDWKDPGAQAVANKVIAGLRPGAVVVMHDGAGHGKQAAAAIPLIVTAARAQGYELGSLCPMTP